MYTMYRLFNSVYTVTHSVITLQTNYTDIYSIHSRVYDSGTRYTQFRQSNSICKRKTDTCMYMNNMCTCKHMCRVACTCRPMSIAILYAHEYV